MNTNLLKNAIKTTLPVMAGYIVLGIGFGILLEVNGYGVWWSLAMSVFVYAGAMQYVGVALITSGASLISVALTTLMVNARHLFYGITMIDRYKGAGWKKLLLMHTLTDESYSLICSNKAPENSEPHQYYLLISLCDMLYWVIGCVLGSLIGSAITFDLTGIDFSMTALYVIIFVEQWLTTDDHRPALIGLGASVLCLLIFGPKNFLIPAMFLIIILLTAMRKRLENWRPYND